MINFKKGKYNLILGVLLGFILAQIVLIEGYALIGEQSTDIGKFKILSAIVFFSMIVFFNGKRFTNVNLDRISIYLSLVTLISLIVAIEGSLIICLIIFSIFPNIQYILLENNFFSVNIEFLIGFMGIALFLITFILLVNKKVRYIKFLTKGVKLIKNEGFGKIIEVKGEDELAELCRNINSMSIELGEKIKNEKRIEQNKNELITNISHDLKTPLTSIVGYLELLNNRETDYETKSEYAKIAYNKSLRLKLLVNELFEYTKLSSNDIKLQKKKVNIAMLLNQVVGESIINFIDKDIKVLIDNPYKEAFAKVDTVQILRVFENLIKNAEKYGDSHSEFRATLTINEGKILISFMNECENITENDLERLFEKFYRQDKARHKEGSGLGLAIVKRIIELHEGRITVEKIEKSIKFNIILNEA